MICSDGPRRDLHGCHQTLEEASSRAHALVDLWEDGQKLFQTDCKEWRERVSEIGGLHPGQQVTYEGQTARSDRQLSVSGSVCAQVKERLRAMTPWSKPKRKPPLHVSKEGRGQDEL